MPRSTSLRRLGISMLLGIGLGIFSSRADLLPVDTLLHVVVALGNAVGPWVAGGFAAGVVQGTPRRGAFGGAIALCVGVTTYYVAAPLTWGDRTPSFLPALALVWLGIAAASGAAVGAAGGVWASDGRSRIVGPIVLGAALLAEAAYRLVEVEAWHGIDIARTGVQIAAVNILGALLLPVGLLERNRWTSAYLGIIVVAAVGFLGLAGVELLVRSWLSGLSG